MLHCTCGIIGGKSIIYGTTCRSNITLFFVYFDSKISGLCLFMIESKDNPKLTFFSHDNIMAVVLVMHVAQHVNR